MLTTTEFESRLGVLARTPPGLDALLRGLSGDWARSSGDPEDWAPLDVVAHLIHCEQVDWLPRAKIILEHGESRAFEPFDRLSPFGKADAKPLGELLDRFAALRGANLEELRSLELGDDDFARTGTHPELGRVTLGELISTWTVHDLSHVAQIARWLARRGTDAVGAWRAYLPVLG